MAARTKRRRGFLDGYKLDETYLRRPDRAVGRVGLLEGVGADGEAVLVKVWPRSPKQDDADLEAIWRHELRQLHRLAGHPSAFGIVAGLREAGVDASGFYLVLDSGRRRPLATIIDGANAGQWLRQPRLNINRLRLWRNLRRVACALEALHLEGMLHRDLDAWSVLTEGGEEPDFQLTGFEWSMRLVTGAGTKRANNQKNAAAVASFREDWAMFGILAAELLQADAAKLAKLDVAASDVSDHLIAAEARTIRNLMGLRKMDRLDGDIVIGWIDEITASLAADAAGREMKLNIVVNLGPRSGLTDKVAEMIGSDAASATKNDLAAYVEADLAGAPLLTAVRYQEFGAIELLLRGHDLIYRLRAYKHPRAEAVPSWDFAFCDSVQEAAPAPGNVVDSRELHGTELQLMTTGDAIERFPRARGKLRSWEGIRSSFERAIEPATEEVLTHRALTLTLTLELLLAVCDAFPVEIVPRGAGDDEETLVLRSRRDADRDALSKAMGLKSPTDRLLAALIGDGMRTEGWTLTEGTSVGDRVMSDTEWKFDREERRRGSASLFRFSGSAPPQVGQNLFIVPEDSVGRDAQLRRRLKALGVLRDHRELLGMLARPRRRIVDSHETFNPEEARGLDVSKKSALLGLVSILPLYLVQGPPGVGKTRLVRELAKIRFSDDPSIRILLTAQSNAAVDHLLDEVGPVANASSQAPLIVRCRVGGDAEDPHPLEVHVRAREILGRIFASELGRNARPKLRAEIATLVREADAGAKGVVDAQPGVGRKGKKAGKRQTSTYAARTFEGVVMRAANLVFATTNSAELEVLIEERGQFDWTIIEEAGKATGAELVAPQLLSHRRLMIGDHKQLPPFGADRMVELLSAPERVADALRLGGIYIGRSLRDKTTEIILDELEDETADIAPLCARAIGLVTLFQTLIETEFARQATSGKLRAIASRLNEQHRMHPVIASMVARCFYPEGPDGKLTTHPDCAAHFADDPRPFSSLDEARLPAAPIVVIDMPHAQSTIGRGTPERKPRWHNPDELAAVLKILTLLRANPADVPPTLAVLSPYTQQVLRMERAIADATEAELSHLGEFGLATGGSGRAFTVDSFQGGEADVIVVSLVRNNDHSSVRNALGFLADARRMNVLLSRARWQLVLVASIDFLKEIVTTAEIDGSAEDLTFLRELLATIDTGVADGSMAMVPVATLMEETR